MTEASQKTGPKKKDRKVGGVYTYCPPWRADGLAGHRAAYAEGTNLEGAREHLSIELGGQVDDIVNYLAKRTDRPGAGGWRAQLRRGNPYDDVPVDGLNMTTVFFELHTITPLGGEENKHERISLNLTTAEARTMAAQLIHLADLEDLRER
ncbi:MULTISPECIES: hypothetical protein [unclassified Nocardioides]|uniref:hypothetical protein n=1 Tax=unclassified Nocardioides TaxID=2615069 RepID=UPI003014C20E